jgi:aspartate racemase
MAKVMGIIGGMGPLATASLFKSIVSLTKAASDQEHIHIIIDNNTEIPDRTSYLLGGGLNPIDKLVESAVRLEAAGADFLVMPCNTAHFFYDDLAAAVSVPVISMIEETASYASDRFSPSARIGLLATEGTCRSGVYDLVFSRRGMTIAKPSDGAQRHVSAMIAAVKSGDIPSSIPSGYLDAVREVSLSTEAVILGCTELPIAHELLAIPGLFIDTLRVLAESSIRFAGKELRETERAS